MNESTALSPQSPQPSAAIRRLGVFVGNWRVEGQSYAEGQIPADPRASAVPWVSDESYEWLPGGFFLLHRWDATAGTYAFKGTEIIGYDESEQRYYSRFFDNAGNHATYKVAVDGNTWTFSEAMTRATATISDDGSRIVFNWEWQPRGTGWLPLCERSARRTGAAGRI